MQLTKLEIKGFKSFGDKITVNFNEGITGIVGPNGCGKSNIVDAIRWVLGEQKSRALRSEKMENIIFNGTKKRKALQMAEVSLTFENTKNLLPTEYSEVTVTRRYYRSGDSEYELNGVTCRLKDIQNLFLDTGIGPDSYAIIELKMVDEILNDKEDSRKSLFEAAAGVSKFKKRKKETLRKLDDTDKNLERVEDLLAEIERNLKSLERQAKQAEKYFSHKEDYKKLSIELAKASINKFKEEYDNLKKEIDKQKDAKLNLNKRLAEKEAEGEKIKADLISKEKQLAAKQKELNEQVNNIRQYENEKQIKNERMRFLNDKTQNLQEQIDQDRKSSERAEFSIQSLTKEKDEVAKTVGQIEKEVETLREAYEKEKEKTNELQAQVNSQSELFQQKQEEVFQLKKSLEINEVQLNSLRKELEKTNIDDSEQSENIQEFDSKIKNYSKELDDKRKSLEKLQEQENYLNKQVKETEEEIENLREEISVKNRKLDSRQNEFNLTKSMIENLEGFPEAIKFLKKNSNWGKDAPLLSDLLACSEEYRVAIENYLEPYMNYYVVDEEDHAYQAVNLLSDASKGKANFFILSKFEKYKDIKQKEYPGCKSALDIVEFDKKYEKLAAYILKDVYVSDNGKDDLPDEEEAVFISKSGKYTKKRYSVSGGSVGLFEGKKIGRAKNLEKLEKEIKTLSADLSKLRSRLEKKQGELHKLRENTHKEAIDNLSDEINVLNEQYVTVRTKQEQFTSMLKNNKMRREDIEQNIKILEEAIKKSTPKVEVEQVEMKSLEGKIAQLKEELNFQQDQLNIKSNSFNQENIRFHQQKNHLSSLEQEIGYKKSSMEASEARIAKNKEDLQTTQEEIKALLEKAEHNEDELVDMYKEKEKIEGLVNEAEKSYYETRGKIDEVDKAVRELRSGREGSDELLMELQNKISENKLSLNSIKERLSVEFEVNLDNIMDEAPEDPNAKPEELQQQVVAIKEKMERMGPINPMAMEAYEEIKERHDFITKERNDLHEAKESLLQTIAEIDQVAKDTFSEAYEKIRTNFKKVFCTLFTEDDDADLKLLDPDNPLDSKIEIMAKPKGKRPLTINQLSGGEKTLTAVALLFAIYLLKPAPFCIFDEVDAPLDDANIDKFNNIIREFAKESQFILVTHNKRTMSTTDIIYGVTMQEEGVSRMVPVDLRSLA